MTNQPIWKYVENLGDKDFITYEGYLIYKDETGVHCPEMECIIHEEDPEQWVIYRILLERYKQVDNNLIPYEYKSSWPYPIEDYTAWFKRHLESIAKTNGVSKEELIEKLCSEDPIELGLAYIALTNYYGFHEFDEYPIITQSEEEMKERYKDELEHASA